MLSSRCFITVICLIFSSCLAKGQHMTFVTKDNLPTENNFHHHSKLYVEGSKLHVELNIAEYKVIRHLNHSIKIVHPITWTDKQDINHHHIILIIKCTDGWCFYINVIDNKLAFLRLTDRYNKEYIYLPYNY